MNAQIVESPPKQSVRILLAEIIDYAGLFPPSQVSMPEAVINYATYRNSNYGWMLGRFVVPVARLDELYEAAREFLPRDGSNPWRLCALAAEDIYDTIRRVKYFNDKTPAMKVDVLEVKASTVSKIDNTVNSLPEGLTTYFEIAMNNQFADLVSTLALRGQRAKIRTGGVTRQDFPASRDIIRFVRTCQAANVPFKATAGLHHPIRCFKPLTYEPDAPQGTMHGFLNTLLMTGFARESYRTGVLEEVMEEEFEEAFSFHDNGIRWRDGHYLTLGHIERLRTKGLNSFGSCSFDEPIADLRSLGIL